MYKKLQDIDTYYFDVDDTLIMWRMNPSEDIMDRILMIEDHMGKVPVIPHNKHIDALKNLKIQGNRIVVWSQGGSDWAEVVVKALKLEAYVDIVLCKPKLYYDDLDFHSWGVSRVYEDFE